MAEKELELTERERLIAEHAANLAVEKVMTQFYASVGRNVVNKLLIFIGGLAVAYAAGRGWIGLFK